MIVRREPHLYILMFARFPHPQRERERERIDEAPNRSQTVEGKEYSKVHVDESSTGADHQILFLGRRPGMLFYRSRFLGT